MSFSTFTQYILLCKGKKTEALPYIQESQNFKFTPHLLHEKDLVLSLH